MADLYEGDGGYWDSQRELPALGRELARSFHRKSDTYVKRISFLTDLLPCSFLYEPPYLLRVPRISMISGMKLANIACQQVRS